jgi:hypothetical protein
LSCGIGLFKTEKRPLAVTKKGESDASVFDRRGPNHSKTDAAGLFRRGQEGPRFHSPKIKVTMKAVKVSKPTDALRPIGASDESWFLELREMRHNPRFDVFNVLFTDVYNNQKSQC